MVLPKLFIEFNTKNSDNIISMEIQNLNISNSPVINLEVKESNGRINNFKLDIQLFKTIKIVQDLPDWAIVKMLLASGKLKDSGYQYRISNG